MVASIPSAIVQEVEAHTNSTIKGFSFASGGCINQGGRLTTSRGAYFIKWNELKKFPDMFAAEARGLALLRESNSLMVPEVIYAGNSGSFQFLLLEYVDGGRRGRNYWKNLGLGLADLHKNIFNEFGLDFDNYIGSLPQVNERSSSWVEFLIERRLRIQLKKARDAGRIDSGLIKKFDVLFSKLPLLLPEEHPSLLHGDLWGGNVMTTSKGEPCLIDPAVYFGHREVDLAMTQLFGGFDSTFLENYEEVYPLLPGWQERFDLYNLYPLLVHVNLFGGGYKSQVVSILNRFV
ncbi:MAG: fructosamine kinase family protein [Cyclobacteriaceae bacterium]